MSKPLPYYSSQKQAATVTGVSIDVIRQACAEDPNITRSAGRIDKDALAAWLKADEQKQKNAPPIPPGGSANENATQAEIKRLRELVALKRENLKLDNEKEASMPVVHYEDALRVTVSAFRATANALPGRAASKIVLRARAAILAMLKAALPAKTFPKVEQAVNEAPIDYADIEEILQREVDLVLSTLETCDYLETETPS